MLDFMTWADVFNYYILWLMMAYLTDVWKIKVSHAAAIVNVWMGLVKVLPVAFSHLADAFLGNFRVLLLSSLFYSTGLGLIWMSTPPILARSYGNCSGYKPECIGHLQENLLYIGLVLTTVGMAGQSVTHAPFVAQQRGSACDCSCNILHCQCCCFKCRINLIGVVALLVASFVKPWHILFGISAILGAVSLLVLLVRLCQYNYVGPEGSSLTTLFRVVFAASSKISLKMPENVNELHENHNLHASLLPHTESLRFLDKAAIVEANTTLLEQQQNKWRLSRVTEVEETKAFIHPIPILMTFIVCGVISSLGATFFLEQAKTMNPESGRRKIPLVLFLWLYAQFRWVFNILFIGTFTLTQFFGVGSRYLPRVGMAVAMFFSILCCITAAKVESRRLDIVRIHGLIDKPDERVPMNVFSVLPQYIFLAGSDGIYSVVAGCFVLDQASMSMMKHFSYFTFGFLGVGFLASPILVHVVGLISKKASGTNWFQSTLNHSRLDNYYWVLAALASVNLVVYVIIARFYRYRESRLEQYPQLTITVEDCAF